MKKLLAIALASVMAFSTPLTVSAEEIVVSGGTFETENYAEEESEGATGASLDKVDLGTVTFLNGIEDLEDRYHVDFKLSSAMVAEKTRLYSVLEDLKSVTPGQDYIDGQLVAKVESKSMAQKVADGFEGNLQSYQNGIAVIDTELSTVEAVALAADANRQLPAVYPNYIYTTDDLKSVPVDAGELPEISPDVSSKIKELQESIKSGIPEEVSSGTGNYEGSTGSSVSGNDACPNDPDIEKQWYHEMIDTFLAWKNAPEMGKGITVAVIDTGIDVDHPEFAGRIITPTNGAVVTTPYNGIMTDNNGHGTHVAGIIGAAVNNSIGGAGIAPEVNILPIKALEIEFEENGEIGEPTGTTFGIARAVVGATMDGARIINMSLGGPTGVEDSLLQEAVDFAINNGVIVVAAAGNEGWDISNSEYATSPACLDGVVTVASLDVNGVLSNFSNYGAVDISAPGGTLSEIEKKDEHISVVYGENDIYSTFPVQPEYPDVFGAGYKQGYAYMAGTSQACPVVSGVIALMLSHSSDYTKNKDGVESVVKDLKNAAVNIGKAKTYGAGRVNAAAAVNAISIYTKDNNYNVVAGKKLTLLAKTGTGNVKPQWSVSDNSVCTITAKGVFKALKTVTEKTDVTVTATYDGKSATATVTIWPKAATITKITTDKSVKLSFLDTKNFEVTASDGAPVVYKSSNNKVAAVNQNGVISAMANGKATITATTVGGKKATLKVTVTGTPYYIERIIPANKKDRQGAEMFAQSLFGEVLELVATPVSEGKSIKYKAIAQYPYNTASSKDKKMKWKIAYTDGLLEERGKLYLVEDANKDKMTIKNGVLKVGKNLTMPTLVTVIGYPEMHPDNYSGNIAMACKPISGYHFGTEETVTKQKSSTSITIAPDTTQSVAFSYLTPKNADTSAVNPYPYVASSDDEIATASFDAGVIKVTGHNAGKCKVTLTSTDGAYKKATITVTVK